MASALTEIQVCYGVSSGKETAKRGLRVRHLEDAFSCALPRGFVLDGKRKICLSLYPASPPTIEPDRIIDGLIYGVAGGVSILSVGYFDFARYKASDEVQRDELVVLTMENCLSAVARDFGSDESAIHRAADAIRESQYQYECETRLSRSTKDRRLRVHVYVRFDRHGLMWRAEIRSRTGEILGEHSLLKRGSYFDIAADYRSSRIDGDRFSLFDWNNARRATIELAKYAA